MNHVIPDRQCPDCEGQMHEIYIVDRDRVSGAAVDGKLTYAASGATRNFVGNIDALGTIEAVACKNCGRVLLYANRGGTP